MLMASLVSPTMMDKLASGNPWYIIIGLAFVIGYVGREVFLYMKKREEKTAEEAATREKQLIEFYKESRNEVREEKRVLMEQLQATVGALNDNTNVTKELSAAVSKISESQDRMQETQKETIEAVRNLNTDFREMKSWVAEIDKKVNEKESA